MVSSSRLTVPWSPRVVSLLVRDTFSAIPLQTLDSKIQPRLPSTCIDIGANASAEEAEEALDDGSVQVNNIVYSFRLQSTSFDKKSYLVYLKGACFVPMLLPLVLEIDY